MSVTIVQETVTITLDHYEEMKRKIVSLEKEVEQKTIIKYSAHESIKSISLAVVAILVFLFVTKALHN